MGYITKEDYELLIGSPPDDFDRLNEFAQSCVDQEMLWGLAGKSLAGLPSVIYNSLKKAVALQIQFFDENGGLTSLTENSMSSVSLGKFSYSASLPQAKATRTGLKAQIADLESEVAGNAM